MKQKTRKSQQFISEVSAATYGGYFRISAAKSLRTKHCAICYCDTSGFIKVSFCVHVQHDMFPGAAYHRTRATAWSVNVAPISIILPT